MLTVKLTSALGDRGESTMLVKEEGELLSGVGNVTGGFETEGVKKDGEPLGGVVDEPSATLAGVVKEHCEPMG